MSFSNCLQSVRREDRLFISDFSLLILDECHHTCEKHPYAQLMTMIRKATGDIPQVIITLFVFIVLIN